MIKNMENATFYNIMITFLILGLIGGITTIVIAQPDREQYTELYFNNPGELDKYSYNGEHSFSFTIYNHEGEEKEYTYEIKINGKVVKQEKLDIENKEKITLTKEISLLVPFDKAKIEINLPEKQQEIHFWVRYTEHIWKEYENHEDAAIDCLPLNNIEPESIIIAELRGTQAEGFPLLEVLVNGKKTKEIEIGGEWHNYVFGPFEENTIIDLAFVNNHDIKENDVSTWDRNIHIRKMFSFSPLGKKQRIEYVYDRDEWDCEDIKDSDMYWNGALRFKIQ